MNKATQQAVLELLNEQEALVNKTLEVPHDYSSIRECILQMELQQEITALRSMLTDLEDFEEQFKARCAIRETDTQYTIPMQAMPESVTNQLYWEIALMVFKPKTMKDMLAIVVPGIERHLKADLVYKTLVDIHDKQYNVSEASLELLPNLDTFQTQEPTLEQFSQYILSGDLVFVGQDLERFPLVHHAQLYNILHTEYLAVAKKLYAHNSIMYTLSLDILTLNNKGTAPKVAIEQLIKGLTIGGEKMTGNIYAGKSATEAVARFLVYFDDLPNATKEQLRLLEGNNKQLGFIIEEQIKKEECVETTASDLNRLLQHNANQVVLSVSPEMNPQELKALKDKYGPKQVLNTKKDGLFVPVFPTQLIQEVISRIRIKTQEELISLILDFPPSFYEVLWQHVRLDNPYSAMHNLASLIKQGYFNQEQKGALAKALAKVYNTFNLKETLFFWAVQTNELLFLQTALDSYPKQQRLDILRTPEEYGYCLLDKAACNAELVECILSLYPLDQMLEALKGSRVLYKLIKNTSTLNVLLRCLSEDQKLILVNEIDNKGSTLLFEVADCFESLPLLLELYPENQRLDWIKKPNNNGYTVLHKAVTNHHSLKLLLGLYPQEQRLDAIKLKNQRGDDVFSKCADNPKSLKAVLNHLSDEQKQNAVKDNNAYNVKLLLEAAKTFKSLKLMLYLYPKEVWLNAVKETNLLHNVLNDAKSLALILSIYPEDQRLEAVKEENKYGHKIMHVAAHKPGVIKTLLQCLSEEQCQAAFKELDKNANTLLRYANAETLEEILPFIKRETRLELITLPNDKGDTVLHTFAVQPHSLKILLGLFPNELLLDAITKTNHEGNTVLHSACNSSLRAESFKVIMERLLDNQKFAAVMPANKAGYTALYHFADNHILLAEILSFYPEDKRLAAVQEATKVGALHRAIRNPKSVKRLLELYPQDQRLRVVQDISFENWVLLSIATESGYLPSLRVILKLLSEKQRFAAVNKYYNLCRTVLQNAAVNNTSFKEIGEFFSQEQWLALVQPGTEDNILLHYAAGKPELLEEILLHLPEDKRFDSIKIANGRGDTLLHLCVFSNYCQSVQVIFKFLTENQQLELTKIRNNSGNTVLHLIQNPEMVNKLLSFYPSHQRLDALKVVNKDGQTVFHSIAYSESSLKALLAFFPDEEKLAVVNLVDENKNTVLHKRIPLESLKMIWELYTQEQRLEGLKAVNDTGDMAFHFLALNVQHLEIVLASLSMHQIVDALTWVDTVGNSVLHKVAGNYGSLRKILGLYPQEQRLIVLQTPNNNGDMALHLAATRSYSLEELIYSLSQDQKEEAVTIADKNGDTLLHIAVRHNHFLENLFKLVPKDKCFSSITSLGNAGNTPLHNAAHHPSSLKMLLQHYCPLEKRINAVNTINKEGDTVLSYAAKLLFFDSSNTIQECLSCLSEDEMREAVRVAHDNGSPLLHYCAIKNPEYLKTLLALYPENQRLNAAKLIDKQGNTLLHLCGKTLENFEAIVSLYPQEQRLEAAKIANLANLTLVQTTANQPKNLRMLLNLYPKDQRLDAVMRVATHDDALFHWIAFNGKFESLQVVLASLPESQRLVAVKQAILGYTVLHKAVSYHEILKILVALYPQNQRFSALTVAQEGYSETVVNLAKGKPDSLKVLLDCLPEHQRLHLLKMNLVEPFILERLHEILSIDEAFQESFVPNYIAIMRCLSEQVRLKTNCHGFFHQDDDAAKLLGAIDECNAFEDIKSLLRVYIDQNSDSPLAQSIKEIVLKSCGNEINLIS